MDISMAETWSQFLRGNKTVTRRVWAAKHFKAISKRQFLRVIKRQWRRRGDEPKESFELGRLKVLKVYKERLADIPEADLKAEGGRWPTTEAFVENFCRMHKDKGITPDSTITVVRFEPFPRRITDEDEKAFVGEM